MNDIQPGSFLSWCREVYGEEPEVDDDSDNCQHGVSFNDECEDCEEDEEFGEDDELRTA